MNTEMLVKKILKLISTHGNNKYVYDRSAVHLQNTVAVFFIIRYENDYCNVRRAANLTSN
jgi:hypothetical protein